MPFTACDRFDISEWHGDMSTPDMPSAELRA